MNPIINAIMSYRVNPYTSLEDKKVILLRRVFGLVLAVGAAAILFGSSHH